jgi:hypothetical protein
MQIYFQEMEENIRSDHHASDALLLLILEYAARMTPSSHAGMVTLASIHSNMITSQTPSSTER